jgi:hypothetical protein
MIQNGRRDPEKFLVRLVKRGANAGFDNNLLKAREHLHRYGGTMQMYTVSRMSPSSRPAITSPIHAT